MATLLGLTNPVPGHDTIINNRPVAPSTAHPHNNDPNIQNITDPSRIVRADHRTEQQDAGMQQEYSPIRYDSNFQTFLQSLRAMPNLMDELSRILTGKQITVISSGIGEGMADEMGQLMEMLPMDETRLAEFLQGQYRAGTRFGGALFAMLRTAYNSASSEGLRQNILQFLKHYSDHSSTEHIQDNILRSLDGMKDAMPASWANRLGELTELLAKAMQNGDRASGLKLLQGQILPYVSNYVSRTHDMGRPRDLLTMLTLDIARYESGAEEALVESFHQLRGYAGLKGKLDGIDDEALKWLLGNNEFAKASQKDAFADRFSAVAERALRGEGSVETQEAFRQIVSAMLVNESVYMPLNHMIIPMQWDDRMAYSEMWVDPDEDGERSADGERTRRVLLKMDIQQLGAFDLVLASRGDYVEVQVFCPERLAPFTKTFEAALTGILKNNGLTPGLVRVDKMSKPLTISEVFPKIFEGMNSINVKA